MKTSGQLGTRIFGNRSYGQKTAPGALVSKVEKSGYYITANFYEQTLMLLRFGWIDASDWNAQAASTGQAASLHESVYKYKLSIIDGDYRLAAPVGILGGIGPKAIKTFADAGVNTIQDIINYKGDNISIAKVRESLSRIKL